VISRTAAIDAGIALVAAAIVLIVSPGLAVTAIIALIVLVVCGISLLWGGWRRRRRLRRAR
jgi:hypothetical protein